MGHYGQVQTPGQGQDTGRYPTESNVTAIIGVIGESSKGRVAAIIEVIGEAAKAESLLSSESSARMPLSPFLSMVC